MAIPDYQALMLPVLGLAAEGETRVPIAADTIADRLGLSENDREQLLPSGKQRLLHNRIHWAKFYLNKAGLIDIPRRGVFVASAEGMRLLARKPKGIDLDYLKILPKFADYYSQFQSAGASTESAAPVQAAANPDTTPEEQIDAAHSLLSNALRADLLSRVWSSHRHSLSA